MRGIIDSTGQRREVEALSLTIRLAALVHLTVRHHRGLIADLQALKVVVENGLEEESR